MRRAVLVMAFAFVLSLPVALADKMPFDYSVSYTDPVAHQDFTGFNGATFQNVPVFFSGSNVGFEVTLTSRRDLRNIMVVVFQEYYCKTVGAECDELLLDKMAGDSNVTRFYDEIAEGETLKIDGVFVPVDGFSSLDRTHLVVIRCTGVCEKNADKFWQKYLHRYYSFNRLNRTVVENDEWKFFKWGKVILDDPFAGIWCPTS